MDAPHASEIRQAWDSVKAELTGVVARRLVAGVMLLTLVLMVAVIVVDKQVTAHDLAAMGAGLPIFGALALIATVVVGDMVRVVALRVRGVSTPEQRQQRMHLTLRVGIMMVPLALLLLGGAPLFQAIVGAF